MDFWATLYTPRPVIDYESMEIKGTSTSSDVLAVVIVFVMLIIILTGFWLLLETIGVHVMAG